MAADNNPSFWSNAAFWTAAAALLSLVMSKIYEVAVRRHDFQDARRASIVRFKTDFKLRRDDLLLQPEAHNGADHKRRIVDMNRRQTHEGRSLRLHGVELWAYWASDPNAWIYRLGSSKAG